METLMNIWNTFKDQVVPVLITLSTTLLPVIYSMLSSKIKTVKAENAAMAEAIGVFRKTMLCGLKLQLCRKRINNCKRI